MRLKITVSVIDQLGVFFTINFSNLSHKCIQALNELPRFSPLIITSPRLQLQSTSRITFCGACGVIEVVVVAVVVMMMMMMKVVVAVVVMMMMMKVAVEWERSRSSGSGDGGCGGCARSGSVCRSGAGRKGGEKLRGVALVGVAVEERVERS